MTHTLTLKELNRAYLDRQMLITRSAQPVVSTVEQLIGMQSQIPNPPYIGLWSRLQAFERDALTQSMLDRQVVRAPFMRSTLHLMSANDHQIFRELIFPALLKGLKGFFGQRAVGLDVDLLVATAKNSLDQDALSMGELKEVLQPIAPDADIAAISYMVRTYLPIVQVPPGGTWGAGTRGSYRTAEAWLGTPLSTTDIGTLFQRYLKAFGPASVQDFQTWSGLPALQKSLDATCQTLVSYRSPAGKVLYDLPDMSIPDASIAVPVRFMPEYDNLLIGHADRTRIIADAYRKQVFLTAGRVASTILVDGFISGTWKITRQKRDAILNIQPFVDLDSKTISALQDEGQQLLRFVEDNAETWAVVIEK